MEIRFARFFFHRGKNKECQAADERCGQCRIFKQVDITYGPKDVHDEDTTLVILNEQLDCSFLF